MAYNDNESVIVDSQMIEPLNLDAFVCDKKILPTINELNKKGYITSECCSGHYDKMDVFDPFWDSSSTIELDEIRDYNEQINEILLDGLKKGNIILPNELNGNKLKVSFLRTSSMRTYVFFPKKYDLTPPEGFNVIQKETFTCVERRYNHMKAPGMYKSSQELENEIDYYNAILYQWASALDFNLGNQNEIDTPKSRK